MKIAPMYESIWEMSDNNKQDHSYKQADFLTISLPDSSTVLGGEIGPCKRLGV